MFFLLFHTPVNKKSNKNYAVKQTFYLYMFLV